VEFRFDSEAAQRAFAGTVVLVTTQQCQQSESIDSYGPGRHRQQPMTNALGRDGQPVQVAIFAEPYSRYRDKTANETANHLRFFAD
jgi:hypothetical protein